MGAVGEVAKVELGNHFSVSWRDDPKRLVFMLARYKFAAKMLHGKRRVLEIGCGDGFGSQIVRQTVPEVIGIDRDPVSLPQGPFYAHDILNSPFSSGFDGAYSLDCLEHIDPELTDTFFRNIKQSVRGPLIIGTPSLESQVYATPRSRAEHVNCMTENQLRSVCLDHYQNVFMFGMNDEALTTGFGPMCHYRIAICC
jgi:SAM-dependent methyltransferase